MKYQIVDNFLEEKEFLKIKNIMLSNEFNWFYNGFVSQETAPINDFYFIHIFFNNFMVNSDRYYLLQPIFKKINLKSIIRAKGNLYTRTEKIFEHAAHTDHDYKHKGFIFYINTNNGFTKLKNGIKIKSIENRGLFFDPSLEHNSSTCTDQHVRVNINFNYF